MKILLFGGTGLLGSAFVDLFTQRGLDFEAPSSSEVDVREAEPVESFVEDCNPDMIVLCAAYTDVDKAETEIEASYALNVKAVQNCIATGVPLIHFSTDYVFGDDGHEMLEEDHARNPLNVYGHHKAKAERCLEASDIIWFNIRTSWIFGPGGRNFVKTIVEKSKTKEVLSVVDDQVGRPTYSLDLADFVLDHFILRPPTKGHYHLQNEGRPVSWAGLAQKVVDTCGREVRVELIESSVLNLPAQRPQNSRLANTKILALLPDWEGSISKYLDLYN